MDHVDILYYHSVDSLEDARAEGPLEALQALKKDGKTRFIGLSTHKTRPVIDEATRLRVFDVFLVTWNYSMAHDVEMLETIERAAKQGIGIVAMKTQAGGTAKPDAKDRKQLPPISQTAAAEMGSKSRSLSLRRFQASAPINIWNKTSLW